jgi:chemotaxis protein MotA
MDIATIIGLIAGFGFILYAMFLGGDPHEFLDVPAIMIVGGGMTSAALIHFSLGQVLKILSILKNAVFHKAPSEHQLVQQMVNYAAINRRDGALALEKQVKDVRDPFLLKGVQMLIDGQKEDHIRYHLALEVQSLQERHADGKKIMEFMGASAPSWGMVGTLIGLVQMFQTMDDPSKIGAGMATSLVCTFYGAFLANVVFLPLAGKLGFRSKKETAAREMIIEGLLAIARGESPSAVREAMQSFVSARHRAELKPTV